MMTNYLILLSGAVLLILLITRCVKIIHEDERLAVLEMGRMTGLIGPGRWMRLAIVRSPRGP